MTAQHPVLGLVELVGDLLEMIAGLADFSPLLAIAIVVAALLWLCSIARRARGAEVVR